MELMHAVVIEATGGPEVLRAARIPRAVRREGEYLIHVVAAAINPIDAKTRAGRGRAADIAGFPTVLGNDFSGVVVQAPASDEPFQPHRFQPGDAVFGMVTVPPQQGTYAEFVSVPAANIAAKPVSLNHIEAAAVPLAAQTAWGMLVDVAGVHEGQRILIHGGAGGVGHFAIQFARHFGADVTATGSLRNQEWMRELGADRVIDYTAERFDDVVQDLDVVIDLIGNVHDDTGTRSLKVLRPGGLIVNAPTGSWPSHAADAEAAGVRALPFSLTPNGETLATIGGLIDAGEVQVHVSQAFPLDDAVEAHRSLETGHTRGKIVLIVDPELAEH
jgi:NADPH:quinone reductase-like Zn-dependent oxidoreductase